MRSICTFAVILATVSAPTAHASLLKRWCGGWLARFQKDADAQTNYSILNVTGVPSDVVIHCTFSERTSPNQFRIYTPRTDQFYEVVVFYLSPEGIPQTANLKFLGGETMTISFRQMEWVISR